MEWQPIETAPITDMGSIESLKDPTGRILVWIKDANTMAFGRVYRGTDGSLNVNADGYLGDWEITHWMPFPEPPQ